MGPGALGWGWGAPILAPPLVLRGFLWILRFWPSAFFISEVRGLASYLSSLWDVRDLVSNARPAVRLWLDSVAFLCFHCLICDNHLSGFTEMMGPCLTWAPRTPTKGVFVEQGVSPK